MIFFNTLLSASFKQFAMSTNIIERIQSYFSEEFYHQASNSLDESTSGIAKAMSAIVPVAVEGIARKAVVNNDEANSIFDLARNAEGYISAEPNLADLHNDEKGDPIITRIYGSHETHINKAIAQFSGIAESSVSALSTLALPAIMGLLGKYASENNLSASGFAGFLSSQKINIREALPEGMSLAKDIDLSSTNEADSLEPPDVKVNENSIEKPVKKKSWLLPAIIIIVVIALLIFLSRGCGESKPSAETTGLTLIHSNTNA